MVKMIAKFPTVMMKNRANTPLPWLGVFIFPPVARNCQVGDFALQHNRLTCYMLIYFYIF